MTKTATLSDGLLSSGLGRKLTRWLEGTPHPPIALEISAEQVAGVRFHRHGSVAEHTSSALPAGALAPSAIESNLVNAAAVKTAVNEVCARLNAKEESVALMLPDPVIRVFVQHFDEFPRSSAEAIPMLRWKLKKSVPFEVEETLLSYMKQASRTDGVDVVTAIARLRIIKEYEALVDTVALEPGVVMSSTLAAIALLDDKKPTLLARVSGTSLTTAIVREGVLAGYRCTELPVTARELTPQMLLEEVYPLAAYYQDTWQEGIQAVRVAGLGSRLGEFVGPLEEEFKCPVQSLMSAAQAEGRIPEDARPLAQEESDGLVGWMLHRR